MTVRGNSKLGDKAEIHFITQSGEDPGAVRCYQSKHKTVCGAHPQATSTPFHKQGPGCVGLWVCDCLYWTLTPVLSGRRRGSERGHIREAEKILTLKCPSDEWDAGRGTRSGTFWVCGDWQHHAVRTHMATLWSSQHALEAKWDCCVWWVHNKMFAKLRTAGSRLCRRQTSEVKCVQMTVSTCGMFCLLPLWRCYLRLTAFRKWFLAVFRAEPQLPIISCRKPHFLKELFSSGTERLTRFVLLLNAGEDFIRHLSQSVWRSRLCELSVILRFILQWLMMRVDILNARFMAQWVIQILPGCL